MRPRRTRPRTPEQLHAFLRVVAGVDLARDPRLGRGRGFAAPFDYVSHAFFDDGSARDCVVWACRGGGKTFLASVATMLDLVFKPGVEVRALGGSLEQSGRMHEHMRRLFARPWLAETLAAPITRRRVALRCGSVCEIMAQSETSVRGCRPQILRCDEVELFKPEVWEAAQLVTRSRRCGPVVVRAAVEALSTMHEAHGLMAGLVAGASHVSSGREDRDTGWKARATGAPSLGDAAHRHPLPQGERVGARVLFKWSVIDALETCPEARPCATCPLWGDCGGRAKRGVGHIGIDDAIVMQSRCSAATWDAEMLCLRPKRDSLVHPEFTRSLHVGAFGPAALGPSPAGGGPVGSADRGEGSALTQPASSLWLCGMDFGFRAPTVVLWAYVDGEGALRVVDERVESEATLDTHIRAILGAPWPRPAWVGVDPAGRQRDYHSGVSTAHALRKAGLAVRDRARTIHEGVMAVRARLAPAQGPARLFIHERCGTLIESMERLRYPADDPHALTPVKDGADHACDALRYLVVSLDCVRPARIGNYLV